MRSSRVLLWSVAAFSAAPLSPAWYVGLARAADAAPPARLAAAAAPSPAAPAKKLYSVPEDGMGAEDVPASSRLVRDIVAARPNEDLVVCIAGCIPGLDRVIYAQPADPLAKKPAVADAAAQDAPVSGESGATPAAEGSGAGAPATGESKPGDAAPAAGTNPSPESKSADAPAGAPAGEAPKMEPTAADPPAVEESKPEPGDGDSSGGGAEDKPSEEPSGRSSSEGNNDSN